MNVLLKLKEIIENIKYVTTYLQSILKWLFISSYRAFSFGILTGILIVKILSTDPAFMWIKVKDTFLKEPEIKKELLNLFKKNIIKIKQELNDVEIEENEIKIKMISAQIEENKKTDIPIDALEEKLLDEKRYWYYLNKKPIPKELEQVQIQEDIGEEKLYCESFLVPAQMGPQSTNLFKLGFNSKDTLTLETYFNGLNIKEKCKKVTPTNLREAFSGGADFSKIREKVVHEKPRTFSSADILINGGFKFVGAYFMPYQEMYLPSGDFILRNYTISDSESGWLRINIPPLKKGELLIAGIHQDIFKQFFAEIISGFRFSPIVIPWISLNDLSLKTTPGIVTFGCLRDKYNIPLEFLKTLTTEFMGDSFSENTAVLGIKYSKSSNAEFISCYIGEHKY